MSDAMVPRLALRVNHTSRLIYTWIKCRTVGSPLKAAAQSFVHLAVRRRLSLVLTQMFRPYQASVVRCYDPTRSV